MTPWARRSPGSLTADELLVGLGWIFTPRIFGPPPADTTQVWEKEAHWAFNKRLSKEVTDPEIKRDMPIQDFSSFEEALEALQKNSSCDVAKTNGS
jgi:hypothetical protein